MSSAQRHAALLQTALGCLQPYLAMPTVVEIMVNPDGTVWVEAQGSPPQATGETLTVAHRHQLLATIAGITGQVCTPEAPSLDAIVPGSRVRFKGYVPPAAEAPWCVMRRPAETVYTLEDYVSQGVMTAGQAEVLRAAVLARYNIVLAGSTGSGKTTLANTLVGLMPERVISIERYAELVTHPGHNRGALHTSPGRDMTRLVEEALWSRPDRIVIGECRGAELHDLLDAWDTGHPGGLVTLHASTPAETLERLEALMRQVSPGHHPLTPDVYRPLIARLVHVMVCLQRTPDGRRLQTLARLHGLHADGTYHYTIIDKETPCDVPYDSLACP